MRQTISNYLVLKHTILLNQGDPSVFTIITRNIMTVTTINRLLSPFLLQPYQILHKNYQKKLFCHFLRLQNPINFIVYIYIRMKQIILFKYPRVCLSV